MSGEEKKVPTVKSTIEDWLRETHESAPPIAEVHPVTHFKANVDKLVSALAKVAPAKLGPK